MRKNLQKLDPQKNYVFVGTYNDRGDNRVIITKISIYDGDQYLGMVNHNHVARKPFKKFEYENKTKIKNEQKIRFTGKVKMYKRMDCSKDFGIIVNKVKKIVEEAWQKFLQYAIINNVKRGKKNEW